MASDVDPVAVIGGAERILREHSTRLAARGHRVVVLTRREDPARPEHEVFEGIQVYRYTVRAGNPVGFMRSAIAEGCRLFRRICAEHTPDVVNVHQPLAATGVLRAPETAGIPKVYTYLSPWADEYRVRAARRQGSGVPWLHRLSVGANAAARQRIERDAVRACDRIMVLSEFSAGQVTGIHGVPHERLTVIPGAVDTGRFRPTADRRALRRELGFPEDRIILLTVRNLVPRMGLENLVAAMAQVQRARPDALLVIGGSGPLAEPLRQQAHTLGLWESDDSALRNPKSEIRNPNSAIRNPQSAFPDPHSAIRDPKSEISFVGFIPEERLPDYYAAADLFVLPTACLEGFGLVTVEAMACGTPVLGTPVGGTQEILRGFDESFLFSGTGEADLAEGLLQHLPHIRGNEELRARCRTYVEDNYSWDVIIPGIEALFYAARDYGPRTTDH